MQMSPLESWKGNNICFLAWFLVFDPGALNWDHAASMGCALVWTFCPVSAWLSSTGQFIDGHNETATGAPMRRMESCQEHLTWPPQPVTRTLQFAHRQRSTSQRAARVHHLWRSSVHLTFLWLCSGRCAAVLKRSSEVVPARAPSPLTWIEHVTSKQFHSLWSITEPLNVHPSCLGLFDVHVL